MILLEGVRAIALPCTLALLVPGLVAVLAARGRPEVAAGHVVGTGAGVALGAALGAAVPVGLAGRLVVAAVLALGLRTVAASHRAPWSRAAGAAVVGVVAALLWQPCVGPELGAALTAAPSDPWGQLGPLALYGAGATVPVPVTAAVAELLPGGELPRGLAVVGGVVAGVLVLALAAGVWDDVVGTLVRLTLA